MADDVTQIKKDGDTSRDPKRFDCLDTCEEVEFTANNVPLFLEDIDDSTELYLIKAPHNFNGEQLTDKDVPLSGCQVLDGTEDSDVVYEMHASQETQSNKVPELPHILLPHSEGASLMPAHVFKGQLSIVEKVAIPSILLPPSPPKRSNELPPGLKQRFKPFGWEDPTRSKLRAEKPTDSTDEGAKESKRRKKKRDRKDKEGRETGVEEAEEPRQSGQPLGGDQTAMEAEADGEDRKEHRKNKKRKKEVAQTDAVEDDDTTRKKKKKKKKHKDV